MQLTGYRSVSLFSGTSNPVTVALTATESQRIVSLIKGLPKGPGPDCEEEPGLTYQLTARHAAGLVTGTVISGYMCGGAVSVAVPGASLPSWRTDTNCRLYQALLRFLPSSATGTRQAEPATC
jgi:hypothetical protein